MCSSPKRPSAPKPAPLPPLEAAAPAPPPVARTTAPQATDAPKAASASPIGPAGGARKKNAPKSKRSTASLRIGNNSGSINNASSGGVNI